MNDTNIPVKDSIDLLEVDINKNLQFNSHVENICSKVNNQINVISRFRKIVPTDLKCKLYKAFIVPYFKYCSAVWHFCEAPNKAVVMLHILIQCQRCKFFALSVGGRGRGDAGITVSKRVRGRL